MRPSLTLVNPWAEAVLHALAHVRATAPLASSLYNRAWIDYTSRSLGSAALRSLEEDASILGRALTSDSSLTQAQLLAWLFQSADRVNAVRDRTLQELEPGDVDRPELLGPLRSTAGGGALGAALEVLRAAAELEMGALAELLPMPFDEQALASALERLVPLAPWLERYTIELARPLGIRGRLFADTIWIGMPSDALGVSTEHVSMQAAHEATVGEVADGGWVGYAAVEREAVARLAARAKEHGAGEMHDRWLRHFRVP